MVLGLESYRAECKIITLFHCVALKSDHEMREGGLREATPVALVFFSRNCAGCKSFWLKRNAVMNKYQY